MVSEAGQGKDDREFTTTTTYLKDLCIGLGRNLVSFSLRDNRNESWQDFQVWYSRKIKKWPANPQVLGYHVINYTTEQSVSGMYNREHTNIRSVSYMDNRNSTRRRETHRIELWSRSPFESELLNVLIRDRVNSLVETRVNKSLSYLYFSIKIKTSSYWVTVTKLVIIPWDWPKPRDMTIVYRYVIRDESE